MAEKIYYCDICAMKNFKGNLPLRIGEVMAGYCRLCGVASPLVGYITADEAAELGIKIPTPEELSEDSNG